MRGAKKSSFVSYSCTAKAGRILHAIMAPSSLRLCTLPTAGCFLQQVDPEQQQEQEDMYLLADMLA